MTETENLERQLQAAQELLFLVLDYVGEPVELDVEKARERLTKDRRIDLDMDTENNRWTLQVVTLDE